MSMSEVFEALDVGCQVLDTLRTGNVGTNTENNKMADGWFSPRYAAFSSKWHMSPP
jgi:hypothetical protein